MATPFDSPNTENLAAVPENPFQSSRKQPKYRWAIGLGVGLLLLGVALFFLIRSQQGTVTLTDIQPDYQVTLNSKSINVKDSTIHFTLRPGVYRLTITRPHYQSFTKDVQVDKQKEITVRPTFTVIDEETVPTSVTSVDFAQVSPDQKYMYFLGDNRQHLYRLTIEQQQQSVLTDRPLVNVLDVEWSLNPDLAIVAQKDGVYLQEIPKYNFTSQALVKISGPEVVSPVWDPTTNGTRMAFAYYPSSGEKSLAFADKRLQTVDRKADISSLPRVKLRWSPDAQHIALIGTSDKQEEDNLWIYTTANGALDQVTKSGYITDVQFSPDGSRMAVESKVPGASGVTILNPDGSAVVSSPLDASLSNSTWKDSSVFLVARVNDKVITAYDISSMKKKDIPCMFPENDPVKGLFYFGANHTLIYYTARGIYISVLTF